jgi:hypothetical protein
MIKTRGIVVPVDWNADGIAVAFAVSTFDEDEYILEGNLSRDDMMAMIRKEVEVSGELRFENGKKKISVAEIRGRNQATA